MPSTVGAIEVFDFRGDSVLFYNVGKRGERGYGLPNPGPNTVTINKEIGKFVHDGGKLVSIIMHRPDTHLTKAPSLNVVKQMVSFVNRARSVIAGRSVAENEDRPENTNVQSDRKPFIVFPCPYHKVVNPLLKEFAETAFLCMAELMQDGENIFPHKVSADLANRALSHVWDFQKTFATEYFVGLTPEQINSPTFNLSEHYEKYQPTAAGYFDATEFDAPGAIQFSQPQPEDLAILREGIPVVNLPPEARKPYPRDDISQSSGISSSGSTTSINSFQV